MLFMKPRWSGRHTARKGHVVRRVTRTTTKAPCEIPAWTSHRVDAQSQPGVTGTTEMTFYVYAIAVFDPYIHVFKQLKHESYKHFDDAHNNLLAFLDAANSLYTMPPYNEQVLGPVINSGRIFVEVFLNRCFPYLNHKFHSNCLVVLAMCKKHQKRLHPSCAHSNTTNNTSLTALAQR